MFKGSIPALITPFKDGALDLKAFENLIEWQIEQGSHGLVPCGTTGESPTLSQDEQKTLIKRCVEVAKGRVPVIAGTGSNSTAKTVEMTRHAKEMGADAALIVTPYYNKPTQDGLYAHFKTINDAVDIPVILYNIPGRSVIDMSVDTIARLAKLPHIAGVKDATCDLMRPALMNTRTDDHFCQLSGEDGTAAAFLAQGGQGCISVTANIAPALSAKLQNAWMDGDMATMATCRDLLTPLNAALFCETSPAPVKYAASLLGLCRNELRLPMVPATETAQNRVRDAMTFAGLLSEERKRA